MMEMHKVCFKATTRHIWPGRSNFNMIYPWHMCENKLTSFFSDLLNKDIEGSSDKELLMQLSRHSGQKFKQKLLKERGLGVEQIVIKSYHVSHVDAKSYSISDIFSLFCLTHQGAAWNSTPY